MKWSLIAVLFTFSAWAHEVPLSNFKIYAPEGFDDNDTIELVAIGSLPDTCHQAPKPKIEQGPNGFFISITAKLTVRSDCKKISIPYQEKINLGTLAAGSYVVRSNLQTLDLKVGKAASSATDDVMYANVTAIIEEEEGRRVWLIGNHPATCVVEQAVELKKSGDNVWVVLPKVTLEGECVEESRPFKIAIDVPYDDTMKRGVLLHVRVMDGRSMNFLFQNLAKR
jgi:hypothetical protein